MKIYLFLNFLYYFGHIEDVFLFLIYFPGGLFDMIIIDFHWKGFHFSFVVETSLTWQRKKNFSVVSCLFGTTMFVYLWIYLDFHWKLKSLCMGPLCLLLWICERVKIIIFLLWICYLFVWVLFWYDVLNA